MSAPPRTVIINTFVTDVKRNFIDSLSKLFIVVGTIFGINRLLLLGKYKIIYIIIAYVYSIITISMYLVAAIYYSLRSPLNILNCVLDILSYVLCTILSSILYRRLRNYFKELSKFDRSSGCQINIKKAEILYIVQLILTLLFIIIVLSLLYSHTEHIPGFFIFLIPIKMVHALELHFYNHLLGLILPKVELLSLILNKSYPIDEVTKVKSKENKERTLRNVEMRKLTDLYYMIISAYDTLNDSIKWQLIVMVTSSFILCLSHLYIIAKYVFWKTKEVHEYNLKMNAGIVVIQILPMFPICISGDRLHKEVLRLQERLACTLYETRIDKVDRRSAQALLTLTQTRNLSFSLFHMFNVDVSLPFKLLSLLVTYLIIMLQFDIVRSDKQQ